VLPGSTGNVERAGHAITRTNRTVRRPARRISVRTRRHTRSVLRRSAPRTRSRRSASGGDSTRSSRTAEDRSTFMLTAHSKVACSQVVLYDGVHTRVMPWSPRSETLLGSSSRSVVNVSAYPRLASPTAAMTASSHPPLTLPSSFAFRHLRPGACDSTYPSKRQHLTWRHSSPSTRQPARSSEKYQ
jgi:hypothetical protein